MQAGQTSARSRKSSRSVKFKQASTRHRSALKEKRSKPKKGKPLNRSQSFLNSTARSNRSSKRGKRLRASYMPMDSDEEDRVIERLSKPVDHSHLRKKIEKEQK